MASIKSALIVIPEVEGWQGWVVLGLVGFMLFALVAELAPPYLAMMGTLLVCLALQIVNIKAAFHGFSDEAMLSVAVLFVVAKGIEMSGGLEYVASVLFKAPNQSRSTRPGSSPSRSEGSIVWVLLKFCVPVAIFSAFLANIPLVAMMIPPILEFGNKVKVSPSKMLVPLSYAAQLGGTMTLIGASTNLMVLSMTAQKLPDLHMNLFEIGVVGLPTTIAGIFYILAFSGKLLPDRECIQSTLVNAREYNIVVVIKQISRLAHKSIAWSGLGRQPGLNLVAITRDTQTILDPMPEVVLQPNDRLHFIGVIDSILLIVQLNGLKLLEDEGQGEIDLNKLKATQILVEAVIAPGSSMVHECIADLQCRTRFNATIAAIHRHGVRLPSLLGEIRVEAGDCLLMVVDTPDFVAKHRNNSHFALVSQLPGFKPINRTKAAIASVLVIALVVASGVGVNLLLCALLSSAGLLLTKCLTPQDAMEAIELPVLVMIAAAFGIAEAMVESGAATILAKALMGLAGKSMFGLISCTYIATTLFSLAITNSAAVTIMFPVALAAANNQALDFRPFAYTLMMGASAGFMTPTACPTNLMVYSPGSYKFSDYIHFGGPLQLWLLIVTVGVTLYPKYWYVWAIVIFVITCGALPLIARHKSTHPSRTGSGTGATNAKPGDGRHDDESPTALMLAPGHANEETISRRISQSTIPPRTSQSTIPPRPSQPTVPPRPSQPTVPSRPSQLTLPPRASQPFIPPRTSQPAIPAWTTQSTIPPKPSSSSLPLPPTFSSPFPAPYRLEDSSSSTFSYPFPAPHRLEDSSPSTFPSPVPAPRRLEDSSSSTFPSPVPASHRLQDSSSSIFPSPVPGPHRLQGSSSSTFPSPVPGPHRLEDSSPSTFTSPFPAPHRLEDSSPSTIHTPFPAPHRLDDSSPSTFTSPFPQPHRFESSSPPTFSSPFPAPFRLEDSSSSTSSSGTSGGTRTSQTSGDFNSASFPPPYRLDESPMPLFPSLRTSISGKAAQFIMYDPILIPSDSSSSSSSQKSYGTPKMGSQASSSPVASSSFGQMSHVAPTGVSQVAPPPGPLLLPSAAQQQPASQTSTTTPLPQIPQIMPFVGPAVQDAPPKPKVDIGPFRTRQPLAQRFSSPPVSPSPLAPSPLPSPPLPPSQMFSEATSSSEPAGLLQPEPVGLALASSLSSSSAGLLQSPLQEIVDDSFTDVSISEGDRSSNSSSGSNGPHVGTSGSAPTANDGAESSEAAAAAPPPEGLVSKILRPSFSSILGQGGEEAPSKPITPVRDRAESSSSTVRAAAGHRPSKRPSTYPKSPDRLRKNSRARKKSKSPRSGRGSTRASPRNASIRASRSAAAKRASNVEEEDLTGGISNLLSSRRLSSLNDRSAFSDNASVVDH